MTPLAVIVVEFGTVEFVVPLARLRMPTGKVQWKVCVSVTVVAASKVAVAAAHAVFTVTVIPVADMAIFFSEGAALFAAVEICAVVSRKALARAASWLAELSEI